MTYKIFENATEKHIRSKNYNYSFNKVTGFFARWGKTHEDDPDFSPFGPELADIETAKACSGPDGTPCSFCYKSNTPTGKNMSFETFKQLFHNLPRTVNQIAFSADATLTSNPDIWKMFEYCRNNDYNQVIPNITIANISEETAVKMAAVLGAAAVSRYENKNWCYNSVQRLVNAGLKQTNIHALCSMNTYDLLVETINDYHTDPRLAGMNAIVFLSLKQVGRGVRMTPLSQEKFTSLIQLCLEKNVKFGSDSCGSTKLMKALKDHPNFESMMTSIEKCESTGFSSYFSVDGKYYPCSFAEHMEGLDALHGDFVKDVWHHPQTIEFREKLIKNCRDCPLFEI